MTVNYPYSNTQLEIPETGYTSLDDILSKEYTDPLFLFNRIYANVEYLRDNSSIIQMNTRYNYRPDLVAYEYLGSRYAGWVIMAVNKIPTLFEFKLENFSPDEVYVPTESAIRTVLEEAL